MRKFLSPIIFLFLSSLVFGQTSTWVKVGADGKLVYTPDSKGNTIPDFSMVGYRNGNESIPNVAVVKTLTAVSGDNRAQIQAAIDEVSARALDANGFRGAILLKAGAYNVSNTLSIKASGVVLKGEGNGTTGTRIVATRTAQHTLIAISGSGTPSETSGTRKKVTTTYVPVGAKSFNVESTSGYAVGDKIMFRIEPKDSWITLLGMAEFGWTASGYRMSYLRVITKIEGNKITVDIPVVDPVDATYKNAYIYKYSWSKIENVGVENIRFSSVYSGTEDENHAWSAISIDRSQHTWVRNCHFYYFGYSAVLINGWGANTSVLNCQNLDPMSVTTGGRKYSFNCNGQLNLFKGCYTRGGRHDYVTGSQTPGPNVFVSCKADGQRADIGPHHRWATGLLFDNIVGNGEQNAQNRKSSGTGHGWAGAQCVFWNSTGSRFRVQSPPQHFNWAIGCKGIVTDDGNWHDGNPGIWQSTGTFVTPQSLYEKQLQDRLSNNPVTQEPYGGTAHAIPGKIEAENFDEGGEGVAYHDGTSGNQGNAHRTTDVDIQATTDAGGGFNVGWVEAGEWLEYTVNVATAGTYKLDARVAATSDGRTLHVELNGQNISGTLTVPNTGGYQNWQTVSVTTPTLTAGQKILRIVFDAPAINLNHVTFTATAINQLPTVSITSPSNNATFTSGTSVAITANAADSDGSISKVEFFVNGNKISEDLTSPYSAAWTSVAGSHSLTAKATDDKGASTVSTAISITVTTPPTCQPATASTDDGNVAANVLDGDLTTRWSASGDGQWIQFCLETQQTVSGVQIAFFKGNERTSAFDVLTSLDGTAWTTAASGLTSSGTSLNLETFTFASSHNAKHVRIVGHGNSLNAWNSFTEVKISTGTPNTAPAVSITSPSNNSSFTEGNTVTIHANASDADGSVAKVEFFRGATLIGSDNTSPYSINWTGVAPGTYSLTARATDDKGAVTTSSSVSVTVNALPNNAPTVSITSPAGGASFTAPASITISATAADSDGSVTKVEFFRGTTKIGEDAVSPYSVTWSNAAAGTYSLTAKATDDKGAVTTSSTVSITVKASTNTCSGVAQYVENGGYAEGSKVQNSGSQYQCRPWPNSGWCNGAAWAYAPGTGAYWQDAWTLVGACSASRSAITTTSETALVTSAPNPFGNTATITVTVETAGETSVIVYDNMGREVAVLAKGYLSPDTYSFHLDGSSLKAGIYVCKLINNDKVSVSSIVKQ